MLDGGQRVKTPDEDSVHSNHQTFTRPPSAHPAAGIDPVLRETSSPRLHKQIKPPLPQFRSRRKPAPSNPTNNISEADENVHQAAPPWTPHVPFPGNHFGQVDLLYPYIYTPMMVPLPAVYGQIQPHQSSGATVVYTSGPIPANTTSIIFLPMGGSRPSMVPSTLPGTPSTCFAGSGSSVSSESVLSDQPLVVFIERNSFKPWFEGNIPSIMQQLPLRLKRYKSVETFVHWLTSRKKYATLELCILIRVTEINRLLSEVKNVKTLRVFAYEHLFDPSQQPSRSSRTAFTETDCVRKDFDHQRLILSNCLEEACGKLVEFHNQRPLAPTN